MYIILCYKSIFNIVQYRNTYYTLCNIYSFTLYEFNFQRGGGAESLC